MKNAIFFILILLSISAKAQQIKGKVQDSTGRKIERAVVILMDSASKTIAYSFTDKEGFFSLTFSLNNNSAANSLQVRHVNYKEVKLIGVAIYGNPLMITLTPKNELLKEIVINSDIPIQIKGDTVVYHAQKYLTVEDRKLKDLFLKMPGFSVNANGKLTYNGDSVEKLLIDGDDPGGTNYGLITQNASVNFVDKIEVIKHYEDNRLMKNVRRTNNVAVNILTKDSYKMRLSGTAELGLSMGSQKATDATTTILGKKIKQLNFFTANNAGQPIGENFDGSVYKSKEDLLAEIHESDNNEMAIVRAGLEGVPNLDKRLLLHNNDLGVASLMSWRKGAYIKMNGQFGFRKTSQWVENNEVSFYNFGRGDQWETKSLERQDEHEQQFFSTFSFKKDKGKNQTTTGHLILKVSQKTYGYRNQVSGSIIDSMGEYVINKGWIFTGNWTKTILVRKKVLRILVDVDRKLGDQQLNVYTNRLFTFFKLDSSFKYYLQNGTRIVNTHSLDLKLNERKGNQTIEYGWKNLYLGNRSFYAQDSYQKTSGRIVQLNDLGVGTSMFSSYLYGKRNFQFSKRFSLSALGNVGLGRLKSNQKVFILPELVSDLSIKYEINKRAITHIGYKWERSFTSIDKIYPDHIIASNANILRGLRYEGPSQNYSIYAGLMQGNILKGNLFLMSIQFVRDKYLYDGAAIIYPSYSLSEYVRYQNRSSLTLLANKQFYFRSIKSVVKINFSGSSDKGNVLRNGILAEQMSVNGNLSWELNTGLKLPFNANIGGSVGYFNYSWNESSPVSNVQNSWNLKLRWTVNKHVYMAGRWKWYELAHKKGFNSVDYFVLWNVNKSLDLKCEILNLLNVSSVSSRLVNAYSEAISSYTLTKRFVLFTGAWVF